MVAIAGFKPELIYRAVEEMYTAVACEPTREFHFPTGRAACLAVGYPEELLQGLPDAALESFAGVGFPHGADVIRAGDVVLDIGAGSGTDTLIASRRVGATGKVYALDMTAAMREKFADILRHSGIANVEILAGNAEAIPLPDKSVDVVTSNGVLNLVPDKARAYAEIFRVLKPGGRMQIADIALGKPIADKYRRDPNMWAECVVGAIAEEKYLQLLREAGLSNVERVDTLDYFALSSSTDTRKVANLFGAHAMVLRARKAVHASVALPQPPRWRRFVSEAAGVVGAGVAFAICSGFPAVLAALTAIGASAIAQHAYMFPVFVACLGISVWLLYRTAQTSGRFASFWIAAAFGVTAAVAFWLSATGLIATVWWWPYVGMAGVVGASVWSFFAHRGAESCVDEIVRNVAQSEVPRSRRAARAALWIVAFGALFYGMYKSVAIYTPEASGAICPITGMPLT